MADLDVALRLRLVNLLSGPADKAERDLEELARAVRKLDGARGGEKLGRELERTGRAADKAGREIEGAAAAAGRLGRTNGADKLAADLERVAAAGNRADAALGRLDRHHIRGVVGGGRGAAGVAAAPHGGGRRDVAGNLLAEAATYAGAGGLVGLGASVGAPAAAIAGVGYLGVRATQEAIAFETAMADVQKAVDGLDANGLQKLGDDILRISRETGIAKEEVAGLVAQAGLAGRPLADLQRFGTFAAKAAVAWDMSAEETGDAQAKLANVFGLTQVQIEDTADAVNLLGDSMAAKERDIVDFLLRAGPAAKQFGLSANEAGALGAAVLSLGTTSEVAATGFNALMVKLQAADKQGNKFQAGLKAIGLDSRLVARMIEQGPADALIEVLRRINEVPQAQRAGVVSDLMGLEYGDDVARMAGAVKALVAALNMVGDAGQRAGSVEKTFQIFDDTTARKIDKVWTALGSLATHVGQSVTPAVGGLADELARLIGEIDKMVESEGVLAAWLVGVPAAAAKRFDQEFPRAMSEWGFEPLFDFGHGPQPDVTPATGARPAAGAHGARSMDGVDDGMDTVAIRARLKKFEADLRRLDELAADGGTSPVLDQAPARAAIERRIQALKAQFPDPLPPPRPPASEVLQQRLDPIGAQLPPAPRPPPSPRRKPRQTAAADGIAGVAFTGIPEGAEAAMARVAAAIDGHAADAAGSVEDMARKIGATDLDAAQLEAAAKAAMDGVTQAITAGGADAVAASLDAVSKIRAMWNFTLSPTISPRFSPAASPAGSGAAAKPTSGKAPVAQPAVSIQTAHFHGVQDVDGLHRQVAGLGDRKARQSRDNALHDTGALA
jgi:TP901 family phage tail tape measure protein